jgi:hypothetical protein
MIKGQEVQLGFIPTQIYKVLCHKVEITQSGKGFKMGKIELEIVGPETAEAAGVIYKTLGSKGTAYAMLENKNGVDAALNQLSPSLKTLGLYDSLPGEYGQSDVEEVLKTLEGGKFNMLVQSQPEYATDNPEDRFTAAKAKRDENGELIIKRFNTQFDFSQVRGVLEPAAF